MIKRKFNPTLPLRFVVYKRMSSDKQNPRSPEQQHETIQSEIKRLQYPWVEIGSYTDAGISGRLVKRRPEFSRMIQDIRSGNISVDAILVDTFERFGRADELESVRRELLVRHGVLVLTADSRFSDPTSVSGKVLSSFESLRATEDSRIKGHNVLRGKRDAAKLGHWPGGKAPFGYRLENVLVEENGRMVVAYSILVPDPATDWIIARMFRAAADHGWGSSRLTRMLNSDPDIPEEYKPFAEASVNRWLGNPIYYGELVWGEYCTDIIDDREVAERNDPADVLRIPRFCRGIIEKELFDRVEAPRSVRRQRAREARAAARNPSDKLIRPIAPGLTIKYPLSGLIRCGHCNRTMTIANSPTYTTKAGVEKSYASYHCTAAPLDQCPNRTRIPEIWIRETVVDLMFCRLFGPH